MRTLLTAGLAFAFAALLTGQLSPALHWQEVKAELRQAQPQARVKAEVSALLHAGKV